jgi:hypothetical protein
MSPAIVVASDSSVVSTCRSRCSSTRTASGTPASICRRRRRVSRDRRPPTAAPAPAPAPDATHKQRHVVGAAEQRAPRRGVEHRLHERVQRHRALLQHEPAALELLKVCVRRRRRR